MKPEPTEKKVLRSSAKAEPLKGKTAWLRDYDLVAMQKSIKMAENPEDDVYLSKDIKSAVEWLKEKIEKEDWIDYASDEDGSYVDTEESIKELLILIDQAFEDVVK